MYAESLEKKLSDCRSKVVPVVIIMSVVRRGRNCHRDWVTGDNLGHKDEREESAYIPICGRVNELLGPIFYVISIRTLIILDC